MDEHLFASRGRARATKPAHLISILMLPVALSLSGCSDTNAPDSKGGAGSGATGNDGNGDSGAPSTKGGTSSTGGTTNGFDCTEQTEPGEVVEVPAGEFVMGCNEELDKGCDADEKPMHSVSLSAFAIDRTEVTQAEYTACVLADACAPPGCAWVCDATDQPASCVSWAQANAYCAFAGKRLPTEAEWEKAARGETGQKYPWGATEPDCMLANMSGCGAKTMKADSLEAGASPYGALHMAGNMVELVADWYDVSYYESSPSSDPPGPATGTRYSGRGGGLKSEAPFLRASKRDWYDATDSGASLGFRCAQ